MEVEDNPNINLDKNNVGLSDRAGDLAAKQIEVNHSIDHNYYSRPTNVEHQNQGIENRPTCSGSWQEVEAKTKKRSIGNNVVLHPNEKRLRAGNPNTVPNAPLEISNSFAPLTEDTNDNDMADDNDVSLDLEQEAKKEPKPPPIFIPNVINVVPMIQTIETLVNKESYSYKCLSNNVIKLLPVNAESYRKLFKGLRELNINLHTYQLKQERAYRVVLKNMHFSTPVEYIKEAIEDHGHQVRNISNLRHNVTKEPLSIFFIDLEPHIDNKTIYDINYLLNARIKFEPPNKKKEVIQCKRCQRYGHTRSYCWNKPRCVKCSLDHETSKCTKAATTPPKCVHCGGEHPASYRGCKVYKELQTKHFPPLRKKEPNSVADTNTSEGNEDNPNVNSIPNANANGKSTTQRNQGAGASYANVVKNRSSEADSVSTNSISEISLLIQKSFEKFENILSKQADQIGSLLNLLTVVLNKMK